MKAKIESILNLFPEVTWDRWAGKIGGQLCVFGWIARDDGKYDFAFLRFDEDGPWMVSTSSAKHSAEFSNRLGFKGHSPCKRVEDYFDNVNAINLTPAEQPAIEQTSLILTPDVTP